MDTFPLLTTPKDCLTGFYARADLFSILNKLKSTYPETGKPFSLLFIDLDRFKKYNDRHGHSLGDEILKYFSSSVRLTFEIYKYYPVRYGGDEFILIFPSLDGKKAAKLALQLKRNLRSHSFLWKGKPFSITFSGGISVFPFDSKNIEDLVEQADKAMYVSKRCGGGRTTSFSRRWLGIIVKLLPLLFVLLVFIGGIINLMCVFPARMNSGNFIQIFRQGADTVKNDVSFLNHRAIFLFNKLRGKPKYYQIYLKDGRVLKGKTVHQNGQDISVELFLGQGSGALSFDEGEVVAIKEVR